MGTDLLSLTSAPAAGAGGFYPWCMGRLGPSVSSKLWLDWTRAIHAREKPPMAAPRPVNMLLQVVVG